MKQFEIVISIKDGYVNGTWSHLEKNERVVVLRRRAMDIYLDIFLKSV